MLKSRTRGRRILLLVACLVLAGVAVWLYRRPAAIGADQTLYVHVGQGVRTFIGPVGQQWTSTLAHDMPGHLSVAPDNSALCMSGESNWNYVAYMATPANSRAPEQIGVLGKFMNDPSNPLPTHPIAAGADKTCYVIDAGRQLVRVRAGHKTVLPIHSATGRFRPDIVSYSAPAHELMVLGGKAFAIVPDHARAGSVTSINAHGRMRGIEFHDFICCAALSPDGKSLYALFEGGDTDNTGIIALGRFDATTGTLEHAYLPYFYTGASAYPEANFNFDPKTKVVLTDDDPHRDFALSPDGQAFYLKAWYRSDQHPSLIAIDTQTGAIEALPIHGVGHFFLVNDGRQLLVVQAPKKRDPKWFNKRELRLFELAQGKFTTTLPPASEVLAVTPAHGKD